MIINHIDLPYGFNVGSREPIDARFILSKADMAKVGDATQGDEFALPRWPEHYFVLCEDDGQIYEFHKDAAAPNGCVFTRLTRKIDNKTILENNNLETHVPIDNKTIVVNSEGLIEAIPELLVDGVATQAENLADGTAKVNVLFDPATIKLLDALNQLAVKVDEDTIKVGSEGLYADIAAHVDDFTIKYDSEKLVAQYEADEAKGLHLEGVKFEAKVDDDKVKFDSEGKLTATFLRYVGSEGIKVEDEKITAVVDKKTIKVVNNALEVQAKEAVGKDSEGLFVKKDDHTIVLNANNELRVPVADLIHVDSEGILELVEQPADEVVLSLRHDNTLSVTSEGLHVVAKPVIAGEAIKVEAEGDNSRVSVLRDEKTIFLNNSELSVKLADALDVQRAGIKVDANRGLYINIDAETIKYNSEGELYAEATPLVAKDALEINRVGAENQIKVLFDKKTIKLGSEGLYVPLDERTLIYDPVTGKVLIPLDEDTLSVNSENEVYVKSLATLIDNKTILQNANGKIETAVGGYKTTQTANTFFNDYPTAAGGDFRCAITGNPPAEGDELTFTLNGTNINAMYEYKPGAGKVAVRFEYGGYEIYGYMDGTNFILDEANGDPLPADLFGGNQIQIRRLLKEVFHPIDARFFPVDDITIKTDADNKVAINTAGLVGEGLEADGKKVNVVVDDATIIINSENELEVPAILPEFGTSEADLFLKVNSEGNLEWAHAGKVDDVTIEGVSIVQDKVAIIPVATDSEKGVVKFDNDTLVLNSEGQLKVVNLVEDVLLKELHTTAVSSEGVRTKVTSEGTIVDPLDRIAKLDLTSYAKLEEAGYRIELFMDNEPAPSEGGYGSESSYILRARLLDQAGNVLTTSNPIDLPLESMIIDVKQEFGSESSEGVRETILVFVLRNGKEIRMPLGSVVSGFITIYGNYEGANSIYGVKNFAGELKNYGHEVITQVQVDNKTILWNDSEIYLEAKLPSEGDAIEIKDLIDHYELNVLYDDETVKVNSENELYVPIDRETLVVKDGLLVANIDSETIVLNSEGKIAVPIDRVTITINSEGLLEASGLDVKPGDAIQMTTSEEAGLPVKYIDVLYDRETVLLNSENELYVPIDKDSIIVNSEQLIEVKQYTVDEIRALWHLICSEGEA